MGRFLEGGTVAVAGGAAGVSGAASASNPVTGVFGSGQVKWFFKNGSFVVPADVTSVRVRLWGGGGRAGGGFAIKTITGLTPGASIAVTVGSAGDDSTAGGTSSFGTHVSATGGASSSSNADAGGIGIGGDFNSQGGLGRTNAGGGAAGIFGNGGDGGSSSNGFNGNAGGGSGGNASVGGNGVSGKGGAVPGAAGADTNGDIGIVTSLDFIATGGGGAKDGNGANGGGGGTNHCGGFPAGGTALALANSAGAGLVIVEW